MTSAFLLSALAAVLLAYFIGGLPFGYLFVRFSLGKDVRTLGSGNIGATNVHRTAGRKAGLIVLLLDILKGFISVWLTAVISHGDPLVLGLAIVAVMLGHCYPVLLRFKGGKAVACFIGAFLYVAPAALLATTVVFVLVVAGTKFISLASIVGALVFPLFFWLIYHPAEPILITTIVAALLIVYRHQANISRLLSGTENVFSLKGGTAR
ncbi:MAG: acyl-phosphate glycerol-3-phosphate acyltransferase [Bryobacterales bacterium]|nr:acyl-phosphate glycerol-3-phosphate acyltransferase [Bryobacterales bacterium]